MKLATLVNWRVFIGCLATSFALAWGVQWFSGFSYWASWGIIVFAWVAVGISTFFDDDPQNDEALSGKPKDGTSA